MKLKQWREIILKQMAIVLNLKKKEELIPIE